MQTISFNGHAGKYFRGGVVEVSRESLERHGPLGYRTRHRLTKQVLGDAGLPDPRAVAHSAIL
jgi:hypothetical protein